MLRWLAAGSLPGAAAVLTYLYSVRPETEALAQTIRTTLGYALFVSAAANALYPLLARHDVLAAFDLRNTCYGRIATISSGGGPRFAGGAHLSRGRRHRRRCLDAPLSRAPRATTDRHRYCARHPSYPTGRAWASRHGVGRFLGAGILVARFDPRHCRRFSRHQHRTGLVATACPGDGSHLCGRALAEAVTTTRVGFVRIDFCPGA